MRTALPEAKPFQPGDLEILARTIVGEARGEPFEGQVAVAWVVRNRSAFPVRFGAGISGVCLKPLQFSCWNRTDPSFHRVVTAALPDPVYAKALAAAALVLTGEVMDPTHGADHYIATSIKPPSWAKSMKVTATIGRHIFFAEHG